MCPLKSYLPTTKRCSRSAKMCPLSVEFPSDIKYIVEAVRFSMYVCACVYVIKQPRTHYPFATGPTGLT